VSRTLRRPMFRRGGPANDGIMSGIVDREEKQIGDVAGRAREITPELEALLREFTPKTRLPIGQVGFALATGVDPLEALGAGYSQFVKKDDAREAAIRSGAVKLGIGQAMKESLPDKMSQIALKAKEAFGKKVTNPKTGKPFASFNEAYTYYSMSATDPGRRSIPGDIERSKQNFISLGTYGDNEVYAERHAIANTIVKESVPQGENYTGKRIKVDKKTGEYKTKNQVPGIYVDIDKNIIVEINPDGTTQERPELTAILQNYR